MITLIVSGFILICKFILFKLILGVILFIVGLIAAFWWVILIFIVLCLIAGALSK